MQAPETMTTSLYLSRLSLNLRNRDVRNDLANSQALHRRMLDAFPQTSREESGLLYRVDPVGTSMLSGVTALVQSAAEPDWSRLPEGYLIGVDGYGFGLDGDVPVKEIASSYDGIGEGDIFRFRLRASPTKRIPWDVFRRACPGEAAVKIEEQERRNRDPRKLNGPRVPVTDYTIDKILWEREHPGEEYQHPDSSESMLQAWMVRKGQEHGFLVADLQIRPDPLTGDMQHGQKPGKNGDRLSHKAIVFDGVLKVTDRTAFHSALHQGIGSGKAYGFGLLSIKRVGSVP